MKEGEQKYSLEKAREEAELLKKRVESGEAKDYAEAENLVGAEKIEKELSQEIIEQIMEKVQDINESGTAYTMLTPIDSSLEKEKDKIRSILKDGLLGQSGGLPREKVAWTKALREEGMGQKPAPVFFNIVDRSIDQRDYIGTGKPIKFDEKFSIRLEFPESPYWYKLKPNGWRSADSVTIIFDLEKFSEVGVPLKKEKEGGVGYTESLKPYTYWASDPDVRREIDDFFREKLNLNPDQMQKAWEPGSDELKALSKESPHLVNEEGLVQTSDEYGFVLPYRIAPELFEGFVLSQKRLEEAVVGLVKIMRQVYKDDRKLLIPIYNKQGNLLWPKQMSHQDVQKFVAGRKKEKEDIK